MKTICVVTGSRAEYGHLRWLLQEIQEDPELKLQVVATGSHLSEKFGFTYRAIEADGFTLSGRVEIPLEDDSVLGVTQAMGVALGGFGKTFQQLKPDVVVVLGDRYEILTAVTAAMVAKIPVAHIHGGESTIGAFDESIRHAITKMSYLHFAAAESYRQCIIQMGESPERVFFTGAPGLDHVAKLSLLSRTELESVLKFPLGNPTFLVTYHPVTLEKETSAAHIGELLKALEGFPKARVIFTQSNADPDSDVIRRKIESFVQAHQDRSVVYASLGQKLYMSAMNQADLILGNSSSGVIEAPSFKKASVNIGDRQKGRLMAESVIGCAEDATSIGAAITQALSPDFQKTLAHVSNPYGGPGASRKIKEILKNTAVTSLKKAFYIL